MRARIEKALIPHIIQPMHSMEPISFIMLNFLFLCVRDQRSTCVLLFRNCAKSTSDFW
jgi:hypothetical protein